MEVTLREAAAQLGVSTRQAQRLAASGRLQVTRWVGRSALIDSESLVAAARTSTGAGGRRWDARTAWAAVDLLEEGRTGRFPSAQGSQLSRLRSRLRDLDAEHLVHLTARRATAGRFTRTRRSRSALESALALSGASLLERSLPDLDLAAGRDRDQVRVRDRDVVLDGVGEHGVVEHGPARAAAEVNVAARLGLARAAAARAGASEDSRDDRVLEGYVHADELRAVAAEFGLVADAGGSVLLHVSSEPVATGWTSTCLDLAERGGTREASAARSMLTDLLERYRRRDGRGRGAGVQR